METSFYIKILTNPVLSMLLSLPIMWSQCGHLMLMMVSFLSKGVPFVWQRLTTTTLIMRPNYQTPIIRQRMRFIYSVTIVQKRKIFILHLFGHPKGQRLGIQRPTLDTSFLKPLFLIRLLWLNLCITRRVKLWS